MRHRPVTQALRQVRPAFDDYRCRVRQPAQKNGADARRCVDRWQRAHLGTQSIPELQSAAAAPLILLLPAALSRAVRHATRVESRWVSRGSPRSCEATVLRPRATSGRAPVCATTSPRRIRERPPSSSTVRPPSLSVVRHVRIERPHRAVRRQWQAPSRASGRTCGCNHCPNRSPPFAIRGI